MQVRYETLHVMITVIIIIIIIQHLYSAIMSYADTEALEVRDTKLVQDR